MRLANTKMNFTVIVSGIRIREKNFVGAGVSDLIAFIPKKGAPRSPWGIEKIKGTAGGYLAGTMMVCPSLRKERPKRWFLFRIAEMVVRNLFARAKRDSPLRILCRIHRLEPS